jgi:hypothetical protein
MYAGAFLVIFYFYLRFQSPAVSTAHLAYRLTLLGMGLVLSIISLILRARGA